MLCTGNGIWLTLVYVGGVVRDSVVDNCGVIETVCAHLKEASQSLVGISKRGSMNGLPHVLQTPSVQQS